MHTLGQSAQNQLRQFIERAERLEEEKRGLSADLTDLFKVAAVLGFDVATMKAVIRLRKKSTGERLEQEGLLATYMHALGMQPDMFASTRERVHEIAAAHGIDPEVADEVVDKAIEDERARVLAATTTISINGGPEVPLDVAMQAVDMVKKRGRRSSSVIGVVSDAIEDAQERPRREAEQVA